MVARDRAGGVTAAPGPPGPASLAPPWVPVGAAFAILVTAVLSGLVWHSTRLPGPDAWVLHLLGANSGERRFELATGLATALRALTVGGIVATALGAWMALRRWNAVALAVIAPAATLAVEKLLKLLVARRAPASTVFHYPSGHVAVATALVLSLVLILRPAMARPRVKLLVGLAAALLVTLMAWARLVETAHLLTDVVGGVSVAVSVTLGAALLVDRRHPVGEGSVRGGLLELHPEGLRQASVQRAGRQHRQRDGGGGDQEVVHGGDEDPEED
ncbi:MAG TPA: phosphatase PAP2 family protein [Actinomycetota bacterium]|nr:phosphatase PAP2 family protein [Actinomycetota bacterium]